MQIGRVKMTFFPHPGCVIEEATFTARGGRQPYARVRRLRVEAFYSGLIGRRKHLKLVQVDGLRLVVPAREERPKMRRPGKGELLVDRAVAEDAEIEFAVNEKRREPLRFAVHRVELEELSPGEPVRFRASLRNPRPPGEVEVEGRFGPLRPEAWKQTPLEGNYRFREADLGVFRGIAGRLSSVGQFKGVLQRLEAEGEADVPDFRVTRTDHAVHVKTRFRVTVDTTAGNARLENVTAAYGRTRLEARGELRPSEGNSGKTLSLRIASNAARIEDLLYLFVRSRPPLEGETRFVADVHLPFDKRKFVERVAMHAKFGIEDSEFANPKTQDKVEELSIRAQGEPERKEDPPVAVSDLTGEVRLREGTANFRDLTLSVPGADAKMQGSYNLETQAVNLRGLMRTDVKLSRATEGMQSFLMKMVEFVKAKKREGSVVPVRISGTYKKPSFGIEARKTK